MTSADPHRARLRALIAERRLVPVIGAGVSRAVAGLPGWGELILDGLDHVDANRTAEPGEVDAARSLLAAGQLVAAAERLRALLGAPGGEFPAWLARAFAGTADREPRILHAIFNLQPALLATTNYDRLITMVHEQRPHPATRLHPEHMQRALEGSPEFVLHLHGHYLEPESVVLGVGDYASLVADEAYAAVLRSLWLKHTLLFVGCSVDGLSDPDFDALVGWASGAFGGAAHTHYALVRDEELTPARAKEFLHGRRIQLVAYGSQWDELPAWLEQLNPRRAMARAQRAAVAQLALRSASPEGEERFVRSVEGIVAAEPAFDIAATARSLFTAVVEADDDARAELATAQRLLRAVADVQQVELALAWWKTEGSSTRTQDLDPPPEFVAGVEQAGPALFLLREKLLDRLHSRGVAVHGRVLDGFCAGLIEQMQRGKPRSARKGYVRENLARILTSFEAILAADPDEVFPPATVSATIDDPESLLLVGTNAIDVRPLAHPDRRATLLEHSGSAIDVAVACYRGMPVIVSATYESVRAWSPPHAGAPIAELRLPVGTDPGRARSFAHSCDGGVLRTAVLSRGKVSEFADLAPAGEWTFSQDVRTALCATTGGRLFVAQFEYLAELRDHRAVDVMTGPQMLAQLGRYPALGGADSLDIMDLDAGRLGDRTVLCVQCDVLVGDAEDERSLVAFVDVTEPAAAICGVFDTGLRTPMRAAWGADAAGPWLHVAFARGVDGGPHLAWARGADTRVGTVFYEEGSVATGDRDLVGLVADGPGGGWACDDRGAIYAYTTAGSGSCAQVAAGGDPGVRNLLRVDWRSR